MPEKQGETFTKANYLYCVVLNKLEITMLESISGQLLCTSSVMNFNLFSIDVSTYVNKRWKWNYCFNIHINTDIDIDIDTL